jgi:hypothetical protein
MSLRRDFIAALVLLTSAAQGVWAQEKKISLFKVVTVKDEIVIGLSTDELKAAGGTDAGAVAHALAQRGDMTVWQYNVHRGANGEIRADSQNRADRRLVAACRTLHDAVRCRATRLGPDGLRTISTDLVTKG